MLAMFPTFDYRMVNPPDSEWPRLSCFFSFERDFTKPVHSQAIGWGVPWRQLALYYNMDKEFSRTASRLAIPQLQDQINVVRDPQHAEEMFKSVVLMAPWVLLPAAAA